MYLFREIQELPFLLEEVGCEMNHVLRCILATDFSQ